MFRGSGSNWFYEFRENSPVPVNWNQGSSGSETFPKSGTEGSLNLLQSKDQNGFFEELLLKGLYTQPLPINSFFEKKEGRTAQGFIYHGPSNQLVFNLRTIEPPNIWV
jgi:hypothetical protein